MSYPKDESVYDLTNLAQCNAKFDQTISVVQHYRKEVKTKSDVDSAIWLLPVNVSDFQIAWISLLMKIHLDKVIYMHFSFPYEV